MFQKLLRKSRIVWDRHPAFSWGFPIVGLGGVVYTMLRPQSPGVCIGLLALAAGIMSVRPKMHFGEKVAWVLMLCSFAVLEFVAINRSDRDSKRKLEEQNEKFEAIISGLSSTIRDVHRVFDKSKQAADLAQEGVLGMTGADSYLFVFPMHVISHSPSDNDKFIILPSVIGKHTVWDGEVAMREDGPVDASFYTGAALQYFRLGPISNARMAGFGKFILPSKGVISTYGFQISSRGTSTVENLQIRFNPKRTRWEYRLWVYDEPVGGTKKSGPPSPMLIKEQKWDEISSPRLSH